MLPLFGPSSVRDGFGTIFDQFLQPTMYFLGPLPHIFVGAGFGLAEREKHNEQVQVLRESALDYYSVLRSAYWQNREFEIEQSRTKRSEPPQD